MSLYKMRILIIEDEIKIATYLVKGLKESGYQAECVYLGLQGLEMLKRDKYDLLILDVMLPDIDGWSVLQVLRQFSKIPVIFLTAKDQVVDRVKGLELGADDYLAKPFSYIELLARIKSLLRRQQYLQENELSISDLKMVSPFLFPPSAPLCLRDADKLVQRFGILTLIPIPTLLRLRYAVYEAKLMKDMN